MNSNEIFTNKYKKFCEDECQKDTPRVGCRMACNMQNFAKTLEGLPTSGQNIGSAFKMLRALEQAGDTNAASKEKEDNNDFTSEIDNNTVIVINNFNISLGSK